MNDAAMRALSSARTFIYRNARPLEMARWQYHFEGGGKEAVLTALAAYQNADGGFGHALEPDAWNPHSSPIQTWAATEILREIGFADASHPIMQGILRYLTSGAHFSGAVWRNVIHSNNEFPHAPWWHSESESASHHDYNPSACLAGFLVRFADGAGNQLGRRVAREAVDDYFARDLLGDMHTASCYIRLWRYLEDAGAADVCDLDALKARLMEQVKHNITRDTAAWETGYICKPSHFFNDRASVFYAGNEEIAEYECAFILRTQQDDGAWGIHWRWMDYPDAWAISKNWWKSSIAIQNLLYLKGMGQL
ncbi:MAG: hypothetical protein ACOYI5_01795 [Christensenellales bacterium]